MAAGAVPGLGGRRGGGHCAAGTRAPVCLYAQTLDRQPDAHFTCEDAHHIGLMCVHAPSRLECMCGRHSLLFSFTHTHTPRRAGPRTLGQSFRGPGRTEGVVTGRGPREYHGGSSSPAAVEQSLPGLNLEDKESSGPGHGEQPAPRFTCLPA